MIEKVSGSNSLIKNNIVNEVEPVSQINNLFKEPQTQQQVQTKEKTEKVINSMNEFLKASNTHLKFQFHDELKEYYVTLVDDTTNEVVKEIPSKKLLDMYAAMTDYLGLLVDKKV
ncbi:flagellar protein FlaG [Neobacillus drentensis]|uniref:flagellar protein FlaG n=1 Tax=Neobacillus drentensis TaxID=220684 RepID=UPI002FFE491D